MADNQNFQTAQGLKGEDITLAAGETAIVTFHRAIKWDQGGVSVELLPGDGGEIAYHHSLTADGDDWTPDLGSPFDEPASHREQGRISRVRIAATGAAGRAVVLAAADFLVEFV